jgi:hypothetical protein
VSGQHDPLFVLIIYYVELVFSVKAGRKISLAVLVTATEYSC